MSWATGTHNTQSASTSACESGPRVRLQNQGRSRWLREVEVVREVAEDGDVLAHRRARVGSTVGARIEALSAEEVVFDELEVGIEAQRLMVDEPALRIRADDESGDS